MIIIKPTKNKDIYTVNNKKVVVSKYDNKIIYHADTKLTFEEQKQFNNYIKHV